MLGPILCVAAYLLGSISFGLLVARRRGIDLRHQGSGNVGATNVGRVVGAREGRWVLVLDAAKGLLPVLAARAVGLQDVWIAAIATLAVTGHCFPIWHRFEGGKGAATAAGVMLGAEPIAGLIAVATYVVAKRATRRASVGSLGGALVGAIVCTIEHGTEPLGIMSWAIAALVLVRHHDNIVRLARGEEPPS